MSRTRRGASCPVGRAAMTRRRSGVRCSAAARFISTHRSTYAADCQSCWPNGSALMNIVYSMPMRIAVLVKQIPAPEQLRFEGTRLARLGVDLEVSAYCRRANAKAVELAGADGEVVVFTMGPPS